ncbi:FMN oxidoreductase [Perkinsela sp. CCAP 1560/4]|nr:FMN oxidoreductase [Perkinsela sp. CCAP 1560/4]|eukprot:KNH09004.1 FMN oxidoreductase [Perkinsela sp. CCAP 1560/4]
MFLKSASRKWLIQKRGYCLTGVPSGSHDPLLDNEFSPRTENFPQVRQKDVQYTGEKHIQVGFLLARQPVVLPDLHPLEHELSNLLQGEYNVYNRHRVGFELDEVASQGSAPKVSGKKAKAAAQVNVKRNINISSQNFWKERGLTLDQWGRHPDTGTKPKPAIKEGKKKDKREATETEEATGSFSSNFFNLEAYADGQRIVANNWSPASRCTCGDFSDLPVKKTYQLQLDAPVGIEPVQKSESSERVSYMDTDYISRRTTRRKYPNFLFHIVQYARKAHQSGDTTKENGSLDGAAEKLNPSSPISIQWSIPYGPRKQGESIRATLDRLLLEFTQSSINRGKFSFYVPSNAPQGVFHEGKDSKRPVYVFIVYYVEEQGKASDANTMKDPSNILGIDVQQDSHTVAENRTPLNYNWVSKTELPQYDFQDGTFLQPLLEDITLEGVGL